ncbi:MAG: T9SS type A sorting domain-containing protein [Lewinella sp.]|nr:T9SS type A sorting domain-containing protein [Lewinella sp.]
MHCRSRNRGRRVHHYQHLLQNNRLPSSIEEELLSNADVRLYPNPSRHSTVFTAEGLLRGEYTLQVQDLTGRPIFRQFLNSTGSLRHEMDISQWPAGLYLCSLTNARGRILATERLLVGGY